MNMRPFLFLPLLALAALASCKDAAPTAESAPAVDVEAVAVVEPTPEPTPEATPEPIDKTAQVTVLGYHRFENPPRDPLALSTEEFRRQLQALKDDGIAVISMEDFLAWRRGEKNIPPRSAIITIDDGYNCTYKEAWPVLREFGYPFTFYVYTDYISAGGRSIKWEELEEMRDAGVDIGSHSLSHDHMVRPKRSKGRPYDEWLWDELAGSKKILEDRLGIPIKTFAYPYGVQNEAVQQKGLEAGYEALFTVRGEKLLHGAPAPSLGRYVILSDNPGVFRMATQFGTANIPVAGRAAGAAAQQVGAPDPGIPTIPAHASTISHSLPLLEADLSSLGAIDPTSVQMRVSGIGEVPVKFDPATGKASYQMAQRLRDPSVTVVIQARKGGNRVQTQWTFNYTPFAQGDVQEVLEQFDAAAEPKAGENADDDLPPEATQPALPNP